MSIMVLEQQPESLRVWALTGDKLTLLFQGLGSALVFIALRACGAQRVTSALKSLWVPTLSGLFPGMLRPQKA